MPGKKLLYPIIAGAFLIVILGASFLVFFNSVVASTAETIILPEPDKSFFLEGTSTLGFENSANSALRHWSAIGWSADDMLISFDFIDPSQKNNKITETVFLKEISEDGRVHKTHEIQFKIDSDIYNKILFKDYDTYEPAFIDNVKYMLLLSPDKKKVLVSLEIIDANAIDGEKYRVVNKGYSAVCNLKTGEITYIDDDSRFVRWSSDSKYVFGINYAACYYRFEPAPYEQHFFPAFTYRHVSYNVEEKKLDVITEDLSLYQSLYITRDIYDNILSNQNLNERKRFLLGFSTIEKTNDPPILKEIFFHDNPNNLNYIIDISKNSQYVFYGNDNSSDCSGFPAIYIGDKGNEPKKKVYEMFIREKYEMIGDTNLIYNGSPLGGGNPLGLYIHDMNTGKDIKLYEGDVTFTYSPQSKVIAIYDYAKKDLMVGQLVDDKIINLKSCYKAQNCVNNMYINQDGSKLYYLERINKITYGVINISGIYVED